MEKAYTTIGNFATTAALGLALADTGAEPARARELLSNSLDGRESFVELQLALAQAALDDAHRGGSLVAFAQAAEAFDRVRAAAGGNQELFAAARSGAFEAKLYAALSLSSKRDTLPKAKAALDQLLKKLRGEATLRKRYEADVRLALGVVLTRLGKAKDAQPYLVEIFKDRQVQSGWAELPNLRPTPKTRDRALVVRALLSQSIPRLAELRELATKSASDARVAERELRAQLNALLALDEAKALGAFRVGMLKAEVLLTRAVVSRTPGPKLEAARVAYSVVRDAVDTKTSPSDWIDASRGIVSVYKAMQASAANAAEKAAPLLGAARDLAALDAAPTLSSKAEGLRSDLVKLSDAKALGAAVDALLAERKAAWNGIDVEAPRYTSPTEDVEVAALRHAIAEKGPSAKLSSNARIVVGIYYAHLTRIGAAKGSSEFVKDGKAGLSVLAGASKNKKAPVLVRHINLILACAALRKPDQVRGQLGGVEPSTFAREALARACGASDLKTLRAGVLAGTFRAKRRAGVLLAQSLLELVDVPRSGAAGAAMPKADAFAKEIGVALALNPESSTGHLLKALVEFSRAGADPAKLKAVVGLARKAYSLASAEEGALEARVQAARLLCYASFAAGGDKALQASELGAAAADGAKVSGRLFLQDESQRTEPANYGPVYWVARIALATKSKDAAAAYAAYGSLLGKRKGPPEAADWEAERAKAKTR